MELPTIESVIAYINLLSKVQLRALIIIAITIGAYLLTSVGVRLLVRYGKLPAAGFSWIKWACLLIILSHSKSYLEAEIDAAMLDKPIFLFELFITYLMLRSLLVGFYGDFWVRRVKRRQLNPIFLDLLKILFLAIIAASAMKKLFDLDMSSMVASSAVLTAIIGFSMQDTIGSLFSGLLIQTEKPFDPGDWIALDKLEGKVIETTWRYTKIQTQDRNAILIPNNSISKAQLLNYSRPIKEVLQRVRLGVPLHVPPVKVKAALDDVLKKCSCVLREPPPAIRFAEIGTDRAFYNVVFYIKDYGNRFAAKDEVNSAIWYEFKKIGVNLPYPTQDVIISRHHQEYAVLEELDMLRNVPLFSGLTDHDLDLLVHSSALESHSQGIRILAEGDIDTTLYILLEGEVEVRQGGTSLAHLEAGAIFGEMALLTGDARQADVVALSPCRCLVIDREGFRILLERNPAIISNINTLFRERSGGSRSTQVAQNSEANLFRKFRDIFM